VNTTQPALKILLIGGSGFVSGTLARTAIQAGHQVWALTRGRRPLPAGIIGLEVDRHDHIQFEKVVERAHQHWDLVVDCIGFQVEDAHQDIAVFANRARHLIFISTDFVYDPNYRSFPQGEESTHYQKEGYGADKRLCELAFVQSDTGPMAWTILRPGHIYGPGSLLGCLPAHSRDPDLLRRIRAGQALTLVGGGHFLQQPIFAPDLAATILSCAGNSRTYGHTYLVAGPEIIKSLDYYRIIAGILGTELKVEEIPVALYLQKHPESAPFLCHRFYDLSRLHAHGLAVPATPMEQGLQAHVASLVEEPTG
jgi:nucleoside-diphosphate-sugar epimerase